MQVWLRFFVGTPRRFLTTAGVLVIIFGLFEPQVVGDAVRNLLTALFNAVMPFVQPVLILGFIILGLGVMIRNVWRKGGSKK